jgi:predicted membrane-bound spermidine synthase
MYITPACNSNLSFDSKVVKMNRQRMITPEINISNKTLYQEVIATYFEDHVKHMVHETSG